MLSHTLKKIQSLACLLCARALLTSIDSTVNSGKRKRQAYLPMFLFRYIIRIIFDDRFHAVCFLLNAQASNEPDD